MIEAGNHSRHWKAGTAEVSNLEQVIVPLRSNGERWGNFELAFYSDQNSGVFGWLEHPIQIILLFSYLVGTPVYWIYMRRALQHLDPSSVIPERVQRAFDAMSEGVAIVDSQGRLLLASQSFRKLHESNDAAQTGVFLSSLPWLVDALPAEMEKHPWMVAMSMAATSSGETLILGSGESERRLTVNCAPISDADGKVRGCLVTFSDVSELHRKNVALRHSLTALNKVQKKVNQQNEALRRLATSDPLTGALNRRALYAALDKLVPVAKTNNHALSCVLLDIDHFKSVNDTYGHGVGDRVIQALAQISSETVRSIDLFCRYGGEEFCLMLPETDLPNALSFAERLRSIVEQELGRQVPELNGKNVTASFGVHFLTGNDIDVAILIDCADEALYEAKRAGRNRVVEYLAKESGHGTATKETLSLSEEQGP